MERSLVGYLLIALECQGFITGRVRFGFGWSRVAARRESSVELVLIHDLGFRDKDMARTVTYCPLGWDFNHSARQHEAALGDIRSPTLNPPGLG